MPAGARICYDRCEYCVGFLDRRMKLPGFRPYSTTTCSVGAVLAVWMRMIKFIRSAKFRGLSVRIAAAAMLAACAATFGAHSAGAAPITLGTASNYGLLL